jgi:FlaA1/EpsC-like NDP-sugar epimerase
MKHLINIDQAIQAVTNRTRSFFIEDIETNKERLIIEIKDKSVLVIGGAGTIGSNYIKALLSVAQPSKLIIVDINENGLTEVIRDLRSAAHYHLPTDIRTYPMNFSDKVFEKMFLAEQPFDIVANFAAHKHVRSEKDEYSIEAMIDNNVMKAKRLLDLLIINPPTHFFCVSTDKAANPVNIMGASKKLMEDVIMTYADKIKITTARFANVAFSNGSLPAGFIERLFKRQPLSCPLDVKRFFVSPIESGQICMMACLLGESSDIFFPKLDAERDMKPFTIIAHSLINQMGMQIEECVSEQDAREKALLLNEYSTHYPAYFFNSDTSGEKPYEEFYTEEEKLDMKSFSSLGIVKEIGKKSMQEIDGMFQALSHLFENNDVTKDKIVSLLNKYIQNFEHIETGKKLDNKM